MLAVVFKSFFNINAPLVHINKGTPIHENIELMVCPIVNKLLESDLHISMV